MRLTVAAAFAPLSSFVFAAAASAQAQEAPSATSPQSAIAPASIPAEAADPAASCCLVSAMTPVDVVFGAAASSRTSKASDIIPIRLITPLIVGGVEVVPSGTTGVAEVIQASKGRMMGKAGELTLAARYLEINGRRISLKRLRYGPSSGRGADTAVMLTTAVVGVAGLLIAGGNINIEAGARANAVVAADTVIEPARP